jgi:hypothetical protein
MLGEFDIPEFINGVPAPHYNRYRQFLVSLDVDLSKIQTRNRFVKNVFSALNLLKILFPAIEFTTKGVKAYGLYY